MELSRATLPSILLAFTLAGASGDAEAAKNRNKKYQRTQPVQRISPYTPEQMANYNRNVAGCVMPPKAEDPPTWPLAHITGIFRKVGKGYQFEAHDKGSNIDKPVPLASLVKKLTAKFIFDEIHVGRKRYNELVKIQKEDFCVNDSLYATILFDEKTTEIRLDVLMAMMIHDSNNIAARALVRHIFGSEEKYTEHANAYLKANGFTQTKILTSTGIPLPGREERTTVREWGNINMALLPYQKDFDFVRSVKIPDALQVSHSQTYDDILRKIVTAGFNFKTGYSTLCASYDMLREVEGGYFFKATFCLKSVPERTRNLASFINSGHFQIN